MILNIKARINERSLARTPREQRRSSEWQLVVDLEIYSSALALVMVVLVSRTVLRSPRRRRPREFNRRAYNSRVAPDITLSRRNVSAVIITPFRIYIDTSLWSVFISLIMIEAYF